MWCILSGVFRLIGFYQWVKLLKYVWFLSIDYVRASTMETDTKLIPILNKTKDCVLKIDINAVKRFVMYMYFAHYESLCLYGLCGKNSVLCSCIRRKSA